MNNKKTSLKDFLEGHLEPEEINKVNRSFEIVGDIAIVEIPEELEHKSEIIGEALLKVNSNIKTVLKKSGIHHGEFRVQDLVYVAGENKTDTIYKENGIKLKINPGTVYFSARLSTEREHLMKNLKKDARTLVMFSGVGPYSFVALKNCPDLKRLTSIEINPEGHRYALENLELNKNLIKKSTLFANLKTFLNDNKLPVFEKKIIEILNKLRVHFFNGDVRAIVNNAFVLKEYKKEVFDNDNYLFRGKVEDVFYALKISRHRLLFLDMKTIMSQDNLIYLLILHSSKFDFVCKIEGTNYIFDDFYSKGILINYLENPSPVKKLALYDEIFMPLPKDASDFLDSAFKAADTDCIVHMYDFVHENDFPKIPEDKVLEASAKFDRKVEIIKTRKVGQYSPRKYRTCTDFKIKG